MAEIVLGIGSSHSPLLNSPAEDYPRHAEIDASGRKLIDKTGKPRTYGELLEQADPSIKDQIRPEVLQERAARCTANIERLERELAGASLDALIIIGDDQHEQFFDDNMPAILVYAGETIVNNPLNMPERRRNGGGARARNITCPTSRASSPWRPGSRATSSRA